MDRFQPRRSAGADAVYYPACISRIMGALPGEPEDTTNMQALLNIAERAGVKLYIPRDLSRPLLRSSLLLQRL